MALYRPHQNHYNAAKESGYESVGFAGASVVRLLRSAFLILPKRTHITTLQANMMTVIITRNQVEWMEPAKILFPRIIIDGIKMTIISRTVSSTARRLHNLRSYFIVRLPFKNFHLHCFAIPTRQDRNSDLWQRLAAKKSWFPKGHK